MTMRHFFRPVLLCAAVGAMALLAQPACAQRDDHDHSDHGHAQYADHGRDARGRGFHGDFHGRDFHHFTPYELGLWRGGHWVHGWHDGRLAWWWTVGNGWYFYPAPIYPFPTYVPPPVVVAQPPGVMAPPPTGRPPAQSWYYCYNPPGYYPYVPACNGPWRPVPAAP